MGANSKSDAAELHQDLALSVLKQFRLIYGSAKQHFRQIEASCGISGSQLWLLQEISRHSDFGVSKLAIRLAIHQSTCSFLVDKLENNGLLIKKRSKEDQRKVELSLTPSAKKLLKKAPGPAEGILPEALQALSDQELKRLSGDLAKLIGQLSARDERYSNRPLADI